MDIFNILAIIVFVLGYVGITLEHRLRMNKSSFALLMGSLLWIIVAISVMTNGVPDHHTTGTSYLEETSHVVEESEHEAELVEEASHQEESVSQDSQEETVVDSEEEYTEDSHSSTDAEDISEDPVRDFISTELIHSAAEIFEIVIFLLAAMSLVEVLVEYQFFDIIRGKIFALGLSDKKQFLVLTALTFALSGIIDNLTATIVMVTIAKKFFKKDNLLVCLVGIIIAANAGGAFSPLGDVTTILLWLAGKFEATEIILRGFIPSLAIYITAAAILVRKIKNEDYDAKSEVIVSLTRSEKVVVSLVFGSFLLPFIMSLLKLPPYLGLLIGLGAVWSVIDIFKQVSERKTHIEASIERMMQKTDLASLKFFIGILLAVSALNSLGLLNYLSDFFYGSDHDNFARVFAGNVGLGMLSALLDNVPLTAIVIKVLNTTNTSLWILLAITVGTGGSLLSVGSAAGVICMGMVHELTFVKYLKIGFVAALISYLVGVAVWYGQYLIFFSP
ncbi:sodium:proton antiporter NhaD [Candidatus Dojkabacteria bacterium]|uniref:Sodium:proton antiporter NhaD n=1 Tax=Candidatus Dojkabacteria bacterium TaxID=2099670 RepID=A0A955L5W6_9BACT|nr:sodium:proton antiporter NhaD [Candidatus Dojkabacteria bacterium]